MRTVTLCFKSVFDLCEFLRHVNVSNVEVQVNLLIGKFTNEIINLAITNYHASILEPGRIAEFLN